jgi:hypothetical protein
VQKTIRIICIVLLFLLLFVRTFRPITAINQDLGRHLLLGKIIFQSHTIPKTNLLSYTHSDYPFINSHWLSEVFFFLIYQYAGFDGLLILTTSIVLLSFGIIFFFRTKHDPLIAYILTACLYCNIIIERTDIRPEIFSFFFFSIFITSLYSYRQRYTKLILLLIPLQIIWVNMHIYFFMGIILLLLFFIDMLGTNNFRFSAPVTLLGVTLLFAICGAFLNPNMIQGALFPLTVFQNYGLPVEENQNIFVILSMYQQPTIIFFATTFFLLFFLLLYHRKKIQPIDWLLFLFFSSAACLVFRSIVFFGYATFILFTKVTSYSLEEGNNNATKYLKKNSLALLKKYSLLLIAILLITAITKIPSRHIGFGLADYGKNSADFFIEKHIQGPLFNDFNMGGYLSARLYPQKVFIDNRPEAYPRTFFQNEYLPAIQNYEKFKKINTMYHFNAIVFSHWDNTTQGQPLLTSLINDKAFSLVYLDDYALIFLKNNQTNRKVIQQYSITKETFVLNKNTDKEALIRYLFFFEKVGWKKQENLAYRQVSRLDPYNCLLIRSLKSLKTNNGISVIKIPKTLPPQCQNIY